MSYIMFQMKFNVCGKDMQGMDSSGFRLLVASDAYSMGDRCTCTLWEEFIVLHLRTGYKVGSIRAWTQQFVHVFQIIANVYKQV